MNNQLKAYIRKHNKDHCCKTKNGSIIKLKDGQSEPLTINNPKCQTIYQIEIDSCLITSNSPKCDYLIDNSSNRVVLIELKATNLNSEKWKSIGEQFFNTIKTIKLATKNCICVLVSSKNNPRANTSKQNLLFLMKKKEIIIFKHLTPPRNEITLEELFKPT
jgi:hypothetical protein